MAHRGTYNPSKVMLSNHIEAFSMYIDVHLQMYDNIIMGDFNSEM